MAQGFIATDRQGTSSVSSWYEGVPQKKWWGVKLPRNPIEMSTWRCGRCGFLENYAEG